jgi:hypothetical protein
LPPSYSTLEVNQDAPEYFKTWREQQLSSSFCGKFNKFSGFWNPGNPFFGCMGADTLSTYRLVDFKPVKYILNCADVCSTQTLQIHQNR